ncbi:MAG: MATE family efflux transporter [Oscillospiraceae bacterium]
MEQVKENKMGTAPMLKLIISMSLPAMFSMLVQAMYNVIDSIFVSKYSADALTAVSLAFPIQILMISVAVGTGVGINSLVSRRLGEGKKADADKAASHGVLIGVICGLVFAVVGLLFTRMFFEGFTSNKAVIDFGSSYIYIVMCGSMSVFLQINLEKTLQATGNMLYPMLFQLSGAITNIIFDPILIFGLLGFPEMGVAGAAVATVMGQVVAMSLSFYIFYKKNHEVEIKLKGFKYDAATIKGIYKVGLPSIIMQSIGALLTTLLNVILIGFSESAVSVLGVYYKLQSFVFMPVFGLTQGIMPIIGFNFGAQKRKRMMDALKIGTVFALIIMGLGTAMFLAIPDKLLGIFEANEEVMRIGVPAFRIIALCFMPAAIGIMFATMFQAIGMGTKSLWISILRQLVLILPAAYVFSKIGLGYVWIAFPLAEMVALVVAIFMMIVVYKKHLSKIPING